MATRLRTRTLVDYLDEDIELGPAADPAPVGPTLRAATEIDRPWDDAEDGGCAAGQRSSGHALLIALLLVGLVFGLRRR